PNSRGGDEEHIPRPAVGANTNARFNFISSHLPSNEIFLYASECEIVENLLRIRLIVLRNSQRQVTLYAYHFRLSRFLFKTFCREINSIPSGRNSPCACGRVGRGGL